MKIDVKLHVPNGLSISGTVLCHKRNSSDYQVPHKNPRTQEEIPGPLYEVEVTSLMSQILPEKTMKYFNKNRMAKVITEKKRKRLEKQVRGLHIEIGNDLVPYICFPNLTEDKLILAVRMWLTHQALFLTEGINLGFFEGYVIHKNDDFNDWLQNGYYMENISQEKKSVLQTKESLFRRVREIYFRDSQGKYAPEKVVEAIVRITGLTLSAKIQ